MEPNPIEQPFAFASPAWHPTWRDYLAHRLANGILRLIASRQYQALLSDAYLRAFRCAIEHADDDSDGAVLKRAPLPPREERLARARERHKKKGDAS